jgi:regulator of sigma E protease
VGSQAETVSSGLRDVFYYLALIAVNLAVMNLLPLPALDGGRVFFLLVNGLCQLLLRRKIPAKYEGYVHLVGMALLLALMAVVAFHDIWRIVAE